MVPCYFGGGREADSRQSFIHSSANTRHVTLLTSSLRLGSAYARLRTDGEELTTNCEYWVLVGDRARGEMTGRRFRGGPRQITAVRAADRRNNSVEMDYVVSPIAIAPSGSIKSRSRLRGRSKSRSRPRRLK
jgi:hypothetical protein